MYGAVHRQLCFGSWAQQNPASICLVRKKSSSRRKECALTTRPVECQTQLARRELLSRIPKQPNRRQQQPAARSHAQLFFRPGATRLPEIEFGKFSAVLCQTPFFFFWLLVSPLEIGMIVSLWQVMTADSEK